MDSQEEEAGKTGRLRTALRTPTGAPDSSKMAGSAWDRWWVTRGLRLAGSWMWVMGWAWVVAAWALGQVWASWEEVPTV